MPATALQVVDDDNSSKMLLVMDYLEGGAVMTREGLGARRCTAVSCCCCCCCCCYQQLTLLAVCHRPLMMPLCVVQLTCEIADMSFAAMQSVATAFLRRWLACTSGTCARCLYCLACGTAL
jgi:hypothetical protein